MNKYGTEENELIVKEFLETITSEKFRINIITSLKNFFGIESVNHGWDWKYEESVFEIKIGDLYRYNTYINKYKEWSYKTKIGRFGHVKKFIKFLLKFHGDKFEIIERLEFKADLNDKDSFNFDKEHSGKHKQPDTAYKRYFMSKEQINQILTYLCDNKPTYYLMFRLLAESGLRKGELLSINLERNIEGEIISIEEDLDKRMIRVKGKKGLLVYPITEDLKEQLFNYLNQVRVNHEVEDKDGEPLFLNQAHNRFGDGALNSMLMGTKRNGEIRRSGILSKLGISEHITPQTFRRSLNELRELKNCPDKWLAILLNHKIQSDSQHSGTNIQYYQNQDFSKVLQFYDKYNPYEDLFSDLYY